MIRRQKSAMKSLPRGVITTMFTDIVESTRIKGLVAGETSARRDANFRHQIKDPHDAIVLTCVRQAGGYVVNPTGDGFCIAFVDAEEAVLCALRIQRHFEEYPTPTPLGPLRIRIGLHTGVANPAGDDYIASTVDKTARVQSQATGGQVFVSQQTQVLVFDKTHGIMFESRGIFDLKGLQAEQLYQAIPLPGLKLPPVTPEDINSKARDSGFAPPFQNHSSGMGGLKRGVVLGGLLALGLVAVAWAMLPHEATEAPAGSNSQTPAQIVATSPSPTLKPTPASVPTSAPTVAPTRSARPLLSDSEVLSATPVRKLTPWRTQQTVAPTPTRKPAPIVKPTAVIKLAPTAKPTPTVTPAADSSLILPVGSQWDGNFHFLPPMKHYDGSVAIHITKRSGNTFGGTYSSEDDKYRWTIEGTVKGKNVHWEFIQVLKKSGPEDAVGKAYGDATIDGDQIQGFYRNRDEEKESAKLDLRLTP